MAVMGFRLAQRANGVSELHGHVAREMFARPVARLRRARGADRLHHQRRARARPGSRRRSSTSPAPEIVASPTDAAAWDDVAARPATPTSGRSAACCAPGWSPTRASGCATSWVQRGASEAELGWVDEVLDPEVLTIGFARRVPSYKRLTLMMRDPERLTALLTDPERPVQIVIAGKAHPADDGGKKLIQELVRFADGAGVRHRIVFLPNYDIAMAQTLYPGCDVWLNNPLRPLEACGTSGMKAALNGCLNLSVLDGWWDEMYDGHNGWAIPTADGVDRPRPPRRPRGRRSLRPDREDRRAAVLRPGRRRPAGPLDRDGAPHAADPRAEGARHPDGARLRARALRARRTGPRRALDGGFVGARELAAWKSRVRAAWPSVRVDHVEAARRRRRPGGRAAPSRCAPSCRSASCRPRTSRCRSCTAGSTRTTRSPARPRCRCATRRPTRAAGTGTSAASPSTGRARSATPPASSRTTALVATSRPSWAWPRCPPRAAAWTPAVLR